MAKPMVEAKLYRKKGLTMMREWTPEEDMSRVSVSPEDREHGSPKTGDMIAYDPQNPRDVWLVSKAYFARNYEPAS